MQPRVNLGVLRKPMTDFFSAYKPLRNYIARFPLLPNLVSLWGYGLHVAAQRTLPSNVGIGRPPFIDVRRHLWPWDIELLVRELLLHSGSSTGPDLANWSVLAKAVNHLRRLEDFPFSEDPGHSDVLLHLHRLAHRQFRWQGSPMGISPVVRALKIYGGAELDLITQSRFSMSMLQLVQLSFAICGHFHNRWDFNAETDFGILGISRDVARAYIHGISCDISTLRQGLIKQQRYDESWAYTWSPLEEKPLIRVDPGHPNRVICPIPRYVLSRGTTGVFYDISNGADFGNKYGTAFQNYVGEVLRLACPRPAFAVESIDPFAAKKGKLKHGPDWVLSDSSAHLVIECKTKRMSLGAKQLSDMNALEKDIGVLAEAVVQTYKNIRGAIQGEIAWSPEGLRIFPMVVTLEDWYLFSPKITNMLDDRIVQGLIDQSIDTAMLEAMPFTIVSANELEMAAQVIAQTGIEAVLERATTTSRRFWALHGVISEVFPGQLQKTKAVLFEGDARAIVPRRPEIV